MCGRFTLTADAEALHTEFGIVAPAAHAPRYNVAPSQSVLAVAAGPDGWRAGVLEWGLLPRWSRSPGKPSINARAETVLEKPSFREPFEHRRCLILADGFYEWQGAGKYRRPMLIRRRDGRPFAFAGLWESHHREGRGEVHGCAIITTTPNEVVRPIHDRMPVILSRRGQRAWLDARTTAGELRDLLVPCPAEELEAFAVSSIVNAPAN